MYYALITLCAMMFSTQFFFNQMFQKNYGSDFSASLVSTAGGSLIGIIALSIMNGFSVGCTQFALIMALLLTLNNITFSLCSLKALGKINLSLYSVFSMLGGMALPFFSGILIFGEDLTIQKSICFVFIMLALFLTIKKGTNKKLNLYYIGVFILNGLSGVLLKIYQAMDFEKVSSSEFSILCAIVSLVVAVLILCFLPGEKRKLNKKAVYAIVGGGILNRFANYFLLIALVFLPASAQYPFITGGTIIFSTVISYITKQKPSKKEFLAVVVSCIGILVLVL